MVRFRLALLIAFGMVALPVSLHAETNELPSVEPVACTIEPIDAPLPGDEGDLNAPVATPSPIATDDIEPADPETIQAVTERIAMAIACQNAGDLLRMLANFSPDWIDSRFAGYDLVFAQRFLEAASTPTPLDSAAQIELMEITDVQLRSDGIAVAWVTTLAGGTETTSLLALVRDGDDWLIDSGQEVVTG